MSTVTRCSQFFFFFSAAAPPVFKAFWLFWQLKSPETRAPREPPGVIFRHLNHSFVRGFANFRKFPQNRQILTKIVDFFKKSPKFFQFCPNYLTCSVLFFFILTYFASCFITLLALRFARISLRGLIWLYLAFDLHHFAPVSSTGVVVERRYNPPPNPKTRKMKFRTSLQ